MRTGCMHMPTSVALINTYSARNLGDLAIVEASANLVRSVWPNSTITALTSYGDDNAAAYEKFGVQTTEAIWSVRGPSPIQKYLRGSIAALQATSRVGPAWARTKPLRQADVILAVGGGYLFSSRRGPMGVGLLSTLLSGWLAVRTGQPVAALPISVGPLSYGVDRAITKRVLQDFQFVASREGSTTEFLHSLGLRNVVEVPDIAFSLRPAKPVKREKRIGVTVMDWTFARSASKIAQNRYMDSVATAIRGMAQDHQLAVRIYPHATVINEFDDRDASYELARRLEGISAEVWEIPAGATPSEVIAEYGSNEVFLATRLHSAIFALVAGIPTVALSYQPKVAGTFRLLGLDEYVTDVTAPSMSTLRSMLDLALTNQPQLDLADAFADLRTRMSALA